MASGTLTYTVTASDGTHRTRTLPITIGGGGSGSAAPNVMLVPMENETFDITSASKWPKASALAAQYAYLTGYYALDHPSQPNYLHLVAGDNYGVTDDSLQTHLTQPTIFDQLTAAGVAWCDYAEALPDPIYSKVTTGGGNTYLPRHNIISAFDAYEPNSPLCKDAGSTSAIGTATWPTLIDDLNSAAPPSFVYFCPTAANQGHSGWPTTGPWAGSASDADDFVAKFTAAVQGTQWYRDGGTILFVWDEGAGSDNASGFTTPPLTGNNGGGRTNVLIVSAAAAGVGAVAGTMNHWGLLGDLQDAYGITTPLGQSQGAWGSCRDLWSPHV